MVKEVKIDKNLINSLINSASKKLITADSIKLNENTASSKVSLTYDALRELLEAIAIEEGFKIYNHECYCAFLKEIIKETNLGDKFDDFRKIRNSINYYGKDVSVEEASFLIKNMLILIKEIKQKRRSTSKK
ncbi:hypothetical protein J4409_02945 [Candidatus Woesearchaeota archaeon]|nr:hypothetical protein [Candidatus Woesearchaeota archaeon]